MEVIAEFVPRAALPAVTTTMSVGAVLKDTGYQEPIALLAPLVAKRVIPMVVTSANPTIT